MAEPTFSPVARVLDTYTAPSTPTLGGPTVNAGGAWRDIAQALAPLNASVNRFMSAKQDELIEGELARGAEQQVADRTTLKEAVRDGKIPEGANPFMKLGYLKSELRQKGQAYQAFLMEEWSQDGAIREAEPDAIPDWMAQKTAAWQEANLSGYAPELVQETFDPARQSAQNQLFQTHISHSFQRTSERARDALEGEIGGLLEGRNQQDALTMAATLQASGADISGIQSEDELRTSYVSNHIQSRIDEAIANGLDGSTANKIAIQQIGAVAEMTGDRSILDTLHQIHTGNGTLGQTAAAKEIITRVDDRISAQQIRDENLAWTRREREQKLNREAALASYLKTAQENLETGGVAAVDPYAAYEATGSNDPEVLADFISMSNSLIQFERQQVIQDDEAIEDMMVRMMTDPNFNQLDIAAGIGKHYNADQAMQLWREFRIYSDHKSDTKLGSPTFKNILKSVNSGAAGGVDIGGSADVLGDYAEAELYRYGQQWTIDNPGSKDTDFEDAMWKKHSELLQRYNAMAAEEVAMVAQPPGTPPPSPEQPVSPDAETSSVAEQLEPEVVNEAEPAQVTGAVPTLEPPADAVAALSQAFTGTSDINAKAAAMDAFDRLYGPGSAATALGLL